MTVARVRSASAAQAAPRVGGARNRLWLRLWRNPGAVIGALLLALIVSAALLAPVLAPHDPNAQFSGNRLAPPGARFPLGTDHLSRDLLSRLLYGARPSISAATVATALIVGIGVFVGAWSGYLGGWVDEVLMRAVDVLLALPGLLWALAIVGMLGPGLHNIVIGAAVVWWAGYARLVRGLALELRERPFAQAAEALGMSRGHILRRHIIPNLISPVIVLASLEMGTLVLIIAGLSFLGLGVQPPDAEWGAMLNQGRSFFLRAPQLMVLPGLAICLTVLSLNLLGDGLRDALDPKG